MRLRRLRGLSQHQLARKLKTSQPAVARIESGRCNVRLSTLVELGSALDAAVFIDLVPGELLASRSEHWWTTLAGPEIAPATPLTLIQNNLTLTVNVIAQPSSAALNRIDQAPTIPLNLSQYLSTGAATIGPSEDTLAATEDE